MGLTKSVARIRRGVTLLLLLYFAGLSALEWLHFFVQHHHTTVAYLKVEYTRHAPPGDGLEEVYGYARQLVASEKCALCDLAYHEDQIVIGAFCNEGHFAFRDGCVVFQQSNVSSHLASVSSSRAPPAFAHL